MENLTAAVRSYKRVLSYRKKENDAKLEPTDAKRAKIETGGPYVLRDVISLKIA